MLDIELQQQQQVEREYDFIMMEEEPAAASKMPEDLDTSLNSSLNVSLNRSGYAHILNDEVEIGIQTDPAVPDHPKLHVNKQNATEQVKSACAWISSICGVSVETSKKALQIVCKDLYNYDVYLSSKEQAENEVVNVKSSKYGNHSYVVPSVRRITEFKQLQASEMEREAAFALSIKAHWSSLLFILIPLEEVH